MRGASFVVGVALSMLTLQLVGPAIGLAPGWLAPAELEAGTGHIVNADLDVDGRGYAVVVWERAGALHSARYSPVSGWADPVALPGAGSSGSVPAVALDDQGDGVVVFRTPEQFPNAYIRALDHDAGSGWRDPVVLDSQAYANSLPKVAINARGDALAAWARYFEGDTQLWASVRAAGEAWGPSTLVDDGSEEGNVHFGHIAPAVGDDGTFVLAWEREDPPPGLLASERQQVYAATRTATSAWGPPTRLSDNNGDATDPVLAANAGGDAIVLWRQTTDGGSTSDVVTARYTGGAWTPPASPDDDGDDLAEGGVIVLGDDGVAIATWESLSGGSVDVLAARQTQGGVWSPAEEIDGFSDPAVGPVVANDQHGHTIVLFGRQESHQSTTLWATRYVPGTGWSIPAVVETVPENLSTADIGLDPDGNAIAWWAVREDADHRTRWNRYISDLGPPALQVDDLPTLTNESDHTLEGLTRATAVVDVNGAPVLVLQDGSFEHDLALAEGTNVFHVRSVSIAGETTSQAITMELDTTPPSLADLSPPNGAVVNEPEVLLEGATEPGAVLTIDGEPLELEDDGRFSTRLDLLEGENDVVLTLTDPLGNLATLTITLTYRSPVEDDTIPETPLDDDGNESTTEEEEDGEEETGQGGTGSRPSGQAPTGPVTSPYDPGSNTSSAGEPSIDGSPSAGNTSLSVVGAGRGEGGSKKLLVGLLLGALGAAGMGVVYAVRAMRM